MCQECIHKKYLAAEVPTVKEQLWFESLTDEQKIAARNIVRLEIFRSIERYKGFLDEEVYIV